MPRFSFTVTDALGRSRSGKVQADSQEEARQRLEGGGYRVVSLTAERPVVRGGISGLPPSGERKGGIPGLPPSGGRKGGIPGLPPSARLRRVWQWRPAIPRSLVETVLALAALGGFLLLVTVGRTGVEAPAGRVVFADVRLRLTGQLRLVDGGSVGDARLVFQLPQVPLSVERRAQEVLIDAGQGRFELELDFSSRKVPGFCILTVEKEGYRSQTLPQVPLQGDPPTGQFPEVRLRPLR